MFISMTVENFRSIKNKNKMSFLASGAKNHLDGNVYYSEKSGANYLKSIGFYGANASGKSNVLLAFEALRYMVVGSGDLKDGEDIKCYEPYKLSKDCLSAPITFEIEFLYKDDVKYIYKISFTKNKIIEESLDFYPNKVKSNIFYRGSEDNWSTISFGTNYKGGIKKIAFFENNAYLSKAGDNAASPEMIRNIYNMFMRDIFHIGSSEQFKLTSSSVSNINDVIGNLSKILCLVDTGIKSVGITEVDVKLPDIMEKMNLPDFIKKNYIDSKKDKYIFTHVGEDGTESLFEESEESDGTRKIFSMMHPIIEAFKDRTVFIFDELDNGLHPHVADLVIKLFNDKTINKVGSQIIFSTHNIQLMDPEKMRRDQIYFVDKKNGSSSIYSLDDFDKKKVKPSTPYNSWYDDGRFGGVPSINFTGIKNLILEINDSEYQEIDDSIFGEEDEFDV